MNEADQLLAQAVMVLEYHLGTPDNFEPKPDIDALNSLMWTVHELVEKARAIARNDDEIPVLTHSANKIIAVIASVFVMNDAMGLSGDDA